MVGAVAEGTMEVGVDAAPMNTELLLTDPFLQLPTESSVNVVWFTAWEGESHQRGWGNGLGQVSPTTTTKLRSMEGRTDDGRTVRSRSFTLQPLPAQGQPLTILLTSDHQSMPNTAANLQKVVDTVGTVDAVFLAGDQVNYPDRSWEWFEAFSN